MLELEAGRGRFFPGTWHAWRRERAARELALGRAIERQQAEIERLERFVTRFRAGTRARQAQSRVKKLDKIERITRDPRDGAALAVRLQAARAQRPGRVRARGRRASRSAASCCSDDAELWLERGEHVSLVGPNGAGKTTLIETLRRPARSSSVRASCGPATTSRSATSPSTPRSYRLGTARTVLEATQRATGLTPEQGAGAARALPVLRRGGREAARRAVGRRAPAPVAGHPRPLGRQRADPRRADQPPRPREPRGPGGGAAGVRRLAAARLARPRAARRGGNPDGGDRGP